MKKLALKLGDLRVETFTTAEKPGGRGTIQGHYGTTHTQAGETCWVSCQGTCGIIPDSTINAAKPTRFCGGDTNDMTGCQPCCV